MSTSQRITNFKKLSRQNTGAHLLDSGSAYGRHHERELPKGLLSLTSSEYNGKREFSATIHLGEFLDRCFEIDAAHRKSFKKFAARVDQKDSYWMEVIENYAAHIGYKVAGSDYTYNWENDLDQNFQFHALVPADSSSDYLYNDDTIYFVQTHNGCDARGGMSEPIPARSTDDSTFMDVVIGWSFTSGTDADGKVLDSQELQELDEYFQVGYDSAPTYRFMDAIETVLAVDTVQQQVLVKLKTGEKVIAYANCRAEYL